MPFIENIAIRNYKSLAAVELSTRRVNIFIGEPNTGKSNLVEALALLGPGVTGHLDQITRSVQAADLFFDHDVGQTIDVVVNGDAGWSLKFSRQDGQFDLSVTDPVKRRIAQAKIPPNLAPNRMHNPTGVGWPPNSESNIRYYQYSLNQPQFQQPQYGYLQPPDGANLAALLYSNKGLRESISALFRSMNFRLEVRPQQSEILVSKEVDDVLYSYRFEAVSETLRRIVFFKAALETNSDAILVFDEPETNTFPFYTKYLAERIALDESNQFFLTTHNPYVLTSLIEKTPTKDLAVFITRMRNYRTEFHQASTEQLSEMLSLTMDVFLDLERFFPA